MNPQAISETWVYLSASPLIGLTLTLLAYQFAFWLYQRSGHRAWANPVLIAIFLITLFLWATKTPYKHYFEGAQFVHFLLGPATVALAVPLFAQWKRLRRMALPLMVALLAGSATAAVSAMFIAKALGATPATVFSLAPKSVTTPIAMASPKRSAGFRHSRPCSSSSPESSARWAFRRCSAGWASAITRRRVSPSGSPRTASAPRAPSCSARKWARFPRWRWDSMVC